MFQSYTISDILTWLKDKTLTLNSEFQRRSVWPPPAKAYLIDTILREYPIPKIYLRAKTDPSTQRSYREVVDGQQRIRAISEFANGKFALGVNKEVFGEYAGKTYEELDEETQRNFLAYQLSAEQLLNADDQEVLDVFQRLNAYGLNLTAQELRHGRYQGALRNAVVNTSRLWTSQLWDKFDILGMRARVRMGDDELMAQMYGVVLEGVRDGGQPSITRLYRKYDGEMPADAVEKVANTIDFITSNFSEVLTSDIVRAPHFLMLFAAVAHALFGVPDGDMNNYRNDGIDYMPAKDDLVLTELAAARANLGKLADVLTMDTEEVPVQFREFKSASSGTTQRVRSRRIRFPIMFKALLPEPL